jgi:hypothetical protein
MLSSGAWVAKISDDRDRNSCFHLEMMLGWTSNRLESSAKVSRYLSASMATWALKAAVNFRLLLFITLVNLEVFST